MGQKGPTATSLVILASAFAGILLSLGTGPAGRNLIAQAQEDNLTTTSSTEYQHADDVSQRSSRPYYVILEELKEENEWKNDLVLFWMPNSMRAHLPRMVESWLRNYFATMLIYFGVGGVWAYYIYWCFGFKLFTEDEIPEFKDVVDQMKVATLAIPLYAALPAITEFFVENGYTLAYSRISDVGVPKYLAYFTLYMTSVEFFVYWQHRNLHDVKIGYKVLHFIHHKYNKEHSMSPFAGLAFHPMDGILQALPYCWTLLYVPMHFLTHELLLFATGIWTTNIHDNIHGNVTPILGAKYHTIHHTAYNYNYGHYTILMDKWFGTLLEPKDYPAWLNARKSKASADQKELAEKLEAEKAGNSLAKKVVSLQASTVVVAS